MEVEEFFPHSLSCSPLQPAVTQTPPPPNQWIRLLPPPTSSIPFIQHESEATIKERRNKKQKKENCLGVLYAYANDQTVLCYINIVRNCTVADLCRVMTQDLSGISSSGILVQVVMSTGVWHTNTQKLESIAKIRIHVRRLKLGMLLKFISHGI